VIPRRAGLETLWADSREARAYSTAIRARVLANQRQSVQLRRRIAAARAQANRASPSGENYEPDSVAS